MARLVCPLGSSELQPSAFCSEDRKGNSQVRSDPGEPGTIRPLRFNFTVDALDGSQGGCMQFFQH